MFLSVLLRCSLTSLTANKRKQIDQVVRYLEDRLRELDEEKEELKKYQQLDKQRRSLEYTILDHELNDARNELASVRSALLLHMFTSDIGQLLFRLNE
jgi:chromosome segregation ATPase